VITTNPSLGNFVQPAATNPVRALLVFLYLLEGDADPLSQIGPLSIR